MTRSAPLFRGLAVFALGTALALGHIAFAAAVPLPASPAAPAVQHASDVDATASTTPRREFAPGLAENCYVDLQPVKGVRGKTVILQVQECD